MDAIRHDAGKAMRKWVGPLLWNYPGRYGLIAAAGAVEYVGGAALLATVGLTKTTLEYGVFRPFVFYPAKVAARALVEAYGVTLGRTRYFRPVDNNVRNTKWFPRIAWENIWTYGIRHDQANDDWTRLPGTTHVFWKENRPAWAPAWLPVRTPRVLGWPMLLRPEHLHKIQMNPSDEFDEHKKFKSTKPHSHEWYMKAGEKMTQNILRKTEELLNYYLTPNTDVGGNNFVDNSGTYANIPVASGAPTVANIDGANHLNGAVAIAGDNAINAASLYYPVPEMYKALNDPDGPTREKARKAVLDLVTRQYHMKHLEQFEELRWRTDIKLKKKLQRHLSWYHAYADWIKFLDKFNKGLYGLDDILMGTLVKVVD